MNAHSIVLLDFAKSNDWCSGGLAVLFQDRPACLVECFFLSNPFERGLLSSSQVRAQLAEAIAWSCGNFARNVLKPAGV